jgi:hypothetical protein
MFDAAEVLRRQERKKTLRANFEGVWAQIATLVLPRSDDFITKRTAGVRRDTAIYDSTAQLALLAFSAAMESMLTPRTSKWHALVPADPAAAKDDESLRWCEALRDLLFRLRYSATSNFAPQASEHYLGIGAFGTSSMFIEDGVGRGIRYQSLPLAECYIGENAWGVIDEMDRRYTMTARQAAQKFGEDDLPEAIRKCVTKEPEREFEFIHSTAPNEDRKGNDATWRGMAFYACEVSIEGKKKLREGGYRVWPYPTSRYTTAARETYGRSPAWDALGDIKTLQAMSKTGLRYGEQVVDPAWVTADVDSLFPFSMRSGAINAGFMNEQGQMLAKSLAPTGDPRFALEVENQRRTSVNRSFLVTLFQILVETPEMTATEAMLRAQEKGALLAPTMGRQQGEFLAPTIARELDILTHNGVIEAYLGRMPDAMLRTGGGVSVQYESPLARLQRSEEGVGILRTLEAATPLAQIDPSVLRSINANRTLRTLGEVNGAPLSMFNTPAEMQALEEQAQAQQQAAALTEAAPVAANTAKTLVEAGQAATAAKF